VLEGIQRDNNVCGFRWPLRELAALGYTGVTRIEATELQEALLNVHADDFFGAMGQHLDSVGARAATEVDHDLVLDALPEILAEQHFYLAALVVGSAVQFVFFALPAELPEQEETQFAANHRHAFSPGYCGGELGHRV
jgi:hypothetical protein